ncbi:glycosyltransferase family 2 protein [Parasedimentitalea psychrophila]|uniref:Glycosyltransferase family 2 protein n=1 Tax=Parasedimentitalea psychrophila TaxID=2997337 RepID=A0A9Y2L2F9_9RHOB|nr:glycosyltransferase family 2 protein [Parasedimentitalea psychrophila]WIY26755.1 glycosyltransferase family 2 protein [Parasedimentitalea psychrophila]
MDSYKKPLGVVTMVYEDYFFLERWYNYYRKQVGAENLYVFSHGNDPKHKEIAKDANVMNLPRDSAMYKFDRRRWRMLGHFATGLLDFYNWMIVSDVDEIVVVDPMAAANLVDHIVDKYGNVRTAPKNISPLCLELIHLPGEEPLPIEENETILSRRRIFRPNKNYSKPCLVSAPVGFGPGGHRNTLGPRHLPSDLYTLHLKYFDRDTVEARGEEKKKLVSDAGKLGSQYNQSHQWNNTQKSYYEIIETTTLAGEDIDLPEFRAALLEQFEKYSGQYIWGPAANRNLYRIPERFSGVF